VSILTQLQTLCVTHRHPHWLSERTCTRWKPRTYPTPDENQPNELTPNELTPDENQEPTPAPDENQEPTPTPDENQEPTLTPDENQEPTLNKPTPDDYQEPTPTPDENQEPTPNGLPEDQLPAPPKSQIKSFPKMWVALDNAMSRLRFPTCSTAKLTLAHTSVRTLNTHLI